MLKQLPLKKEFLLIVATLVLLLLCYKLAFKATFEAVQTNRELKARLTQSQDLSSQPGYLIRKNINLDKIIKLYEGDTTTFRNNSISMLAIIAEKENVKLSEVPAADPFYHTDKFIVQKLDFEGDFFSLTRVLKQLQSTDEIGIIRSVIYKTTGIKNSMDGDKKLVLEVFLEVANRSGKLPEQFN